MSTLDHERLSELALGHEARDVLFYIDPEEIVLNHGSFGAVMRPVLEAQFEWMKRIERNTDRWMRLEHFKTLAAVRKELAAYVGTDEAGLALVDNASYGVNSVLRSIKFEPGDVILVFRNVYPMVHRVAEWLVQSLGVKLVVLPFDLPTCDEKIIAEVDKSFKKHPKIKIAVFEHICSKPAVTMPLERLISLCKANNALVLIDGAHSLGQIPLQLQSLGCDFYTANAHKWLCSSRPAAILYVSPEHRHLIVPAVISAEIVYPLNFIRGFDWPGTKDFTAMYTLLDTLDTRRAVGEDRIIAYNNNLCATACQMLCERWRVTPVVPAHMMAAMMTVPVPKDSDGTYGWEIEERQTELREKHKAWVVIFEEPNGERYFRISAQIYNDLSDFVKFADAWDSFPRYQRLKR